VLYEGLKENAALMVVPSSAVESMGGLGSLAGLGAMMKQQLAATNGASDPTPPANATEPGPAAAPANPGLDAALLHVPVIAG
jgi:hypothetical protein